MMHIFDHNFLKAWFSAFSWNLESGKIYRKSQPIAKIAELQLNEIDK